MMAIGCIAMKHVISVQMYTGVICSFDERGQLGTAICYLGVNPE